MYVYLASFDFHMQSRNDIILKQKLKAWDFVDLVLKGVKKFW